MWTAQHSWEKGSFPAHKTPPQPRTSRSDGSSHVDSAMQPPSGCGCCNAALYATCPPCMELRECSDCVGGGGSGCNLRLETCRPARCNPSHLAEPAHNDAVQRDARLDLLLNQAAHVLDCFCHAFRVKRLACKEGSIAVLF